MGPHPTEQAETCRPDKCLSSVGPKRTPETRQGVCTWGIPFPGPRELLLAPVGEGNTRQRGCRAGLQHSWISPGVFEHTAWHSQRHQPDKC